MNLTHMCLFSFFDGASEAAAPAGGVPLLMLLGVGD